MQDESNNEQTPHDTPKELGDSSPFPPDEEGADSGDGNGDMILLDTPRKPWDIRKEPKHPMEALLKKQGAVLAFKAGDLVEGTMVVRHGTRVFMDLGPYGIGIIYGREYYAAQDIIKGLAVGDHISAKVVELDNEEGYVELSLREAGREKQWFDLKKTMQEGAILELSVRKANSGGLILEAHGVEGFLPASQLAAKNYPRVGGGEREKIFQELQKLIGQTLKVKILDLDPKENKLIFTERGADREEIRKTLAQYAIGDVVEGEITGVVDFGAFMRFGEKGLEGLIHLSEIDWSLVENPRTVLKPGDHVKAKIIDIQGDKISLSLKRLKENPWNTVAEKYHKGDVVRGKITRLNPFGAFVQLGEEIQGLVHVSEFGSAANMNNAVRAGEEREFTVLLVDPREHRLSLGLIKGDEGETQKQETATKQEAAAEEAEAATKAEETS